MESLATLIERITGVADKAHVNMVFGEPKEVQGRTLIPVAEVSYGFGLGLGSGPAECTCGCECECECEDEACCCEAEEGEDEACCCHEDPCECDEEICCCEDESSFGGGGGGGARVRPLAYIDVGPEGAKVVPIEDEQKIAMLGILMVMWCVGWIGLVLKSLFKK